MTATVTPVLSLYSGFWGQIPMLAMNVDKGTLVYNQSQKHPYKLEFVSLFSALDIELSAFFFQKPYNEPDMLQLSDN